MTLVVGMSGWWFHQIRLGAHLPISQQTSTYWEGPPSPRQSSSYRDRAINKTNNLFSECFHSSGRIQTASRKSHLIVGLTLYASIGSGESLERVWLGVQVGNTREGVLLGPTPSEKTTGPTPTVPGKMQWGRLGFLDHYGEERSKCVFSLCTSSWHLGKWLFAQAHHPAAPSKVNICFLPSLLAQIGAPKRCVPTGERRCPPFMFSLIHSSEIYWEPPKSQALW